VFEAMTGSNAYPWFLLSEALAITEGDASAIEALEERPRGRRTSPRR
jgi:hypothetical protein